jgi:hypothetical protein
MIFGSINASILNSKLAKRKLSRITDAGVNVQVAIFQETLTELEKYLDTNDTRKLTTKSLGYIRDDILNTISGIRDLKPNLQPGTVKSVEGTLDKLRMARDEMQVAMGLFDTSGLLKESQSKKFFAQLRSTRKNIEDALGLFKSARIN